MLYGRVKNTITCVTLMFFAALPLLWRQANASEETLQYEPFGTLTLYHNTAHPSHVALFISGDGGWNLGVVDMARALAAQDALVVGFNIRHYIKKLDESKSACVYPAADFERLSQFVQKKLGFPKYYTPVLVGYSSGATLVYATLAQAPTGTFRGGISLGFCPDLDVSKPFCAGSGLESRPDPKGQSKGSIFLPTQHMQVPWIALQGTIDKVCDPAGTENFVKQVPHSKVIILPKVGHGFSVQRNWMPQFIDAFKREMATDPQASNTDELNDLPLVEVAGKNTKQNVKDSQFAIIVTGDGGWAEIDRSMAKALADQGISVIGFNSLKYFWKKRTPEQSSKDLARIINRYTEKWQTDKVILVGYSYGADVLPFMVNGLPENTKSKVSLVTLLGPSHTANFEFHVTDWLHDASRNDSYAVLPEANKMTGLKLLCIYGKNEKDTLCTDINPSMGTALAVGSGHHFSGDYPYIAQQIVKYSSK